MAKTPEQRARSAREATFPKCLAPGCGNVAGLNEIHCTKHRGQEATKSMIYETSAMAEVRHILVSRGDFTDPDVEQFKRCLQALEEEGFTLTR